MIPNLVFATGNTHKLKEAQQIAGALVHFLTPSDIGLAGLELTETSDTLKGNALEKATMLYRSCGCDCFAEDTGLEVDALNGAPGVHTARYAGLTAGAPENIAKLLHQLSGIPHRTARFHTVIALWWKDEVYSFEGQVTGSISEQPAGTGGFGYDPVFVPDGYHKTFAELPAQIKNGISHRARALQKMIDFLRLQLQT